MKHVMYGEKSLLMGDDVADGLTEYAALLIAQGGAEAITVNAVSPDGNTVAATLLLAAGATLSVESTNSDLGPPDNQVVAQYLRERIDLLRNPPMVQPETIVEQYVINPDLQF